MEKVVIVGGGVAGLGCLNALLDRQESPLLLEASMVGSPKMCGEFLAPNVIGQLNQWGVGPMQSIQYARFVGRRGVFQMTFPRAAGAYSRHHAELALAARAREKGGRIREHAAIDTITPATQTKPFILQLTSGEIIEARDVMFATGKWSRMKTRPKASSFIGFKTYIPQVIEPETLLMYCLNGGYLGIVPVSSDVSNLTCLVQSERIEKAGSCTAFLADLMQNDRRFSSTPFETRDWLEGKAPGFGAKVIPHWPHAYWIGDAIMSVHPAIGYGFAHAVSSACMAADYYLQRDTRGYHQAIKRLVRPKRLLGAGMHHLLQKPRICNTLSPILRTNPWIAHSLLTLCDY